MHPVQSRGSPSTLVLRAERFVGFCGRSVGGGIGGGVLWAALRSGFKDEVLHSRGFAGRILHQRGSTGVGFQRSGFFVYSTLMG